MKPLGIRKMHEFDFYPKASRAREATRQQRIELAAAHGQGDDLYFTDFDDIDYEAMEEAVIGLVFDLGEGTKPFACDVCAGSGLSHGTKCPACFGFCRVPSNEAREWLRRDTD